MTVSSIPTQVGLSVGLSAIAVSTTTNGHSLDMAPWHSAYASIIAHSHTGGDMSIVLQESDTGSAPWTNVSGMSFVLPVIGTSPGDERVFGVAIRGRDVKRYVRMVFVKNTNTAVCSMVWNGVSPGHVLPDYVEWERNSSQV